MEFHLHSAGKTTTPTPRWGGGKPSREGFETAQLEQSHTEHIERGDHVGT